MPNVESNLEQQVLEQYDLPTGQTTWYSHDTIGEDDVAHYFSRNGKKYVLVWNDFPNATFIHEENLPSITVKNGTDEWLHIKEGDLEGYYSLYEDY